MVVEGVCESESVEEEVVVVVWRQKSIWLMEPFGGWSRSNSPGARSCSGVQMVNSNLAD